MAPLEETVVVPMPEELERAHKAYWLSLQAAAAAKVEVEYVRANQHDYPPERMMKAAQAFRTAEAALQQAVELELNAFCKYINDLEAEKSQVPEPGSVESL